MRTRRIKPSLFENETLGEADLVYTVLFEGLWCLADRAGRLKDRPNWIRSKIFPYRTVPDPNDLLQWLADNGFISRYSVAEGRYIQVLNFSEYQKPHAEEAESVIPPPDSVRAVRTASDSDRVPEDPVIAGSDDRNTDVLPEGKRPIEVPPSCTCSGSCTCSRTSTRWTDSDVRACPRESVDECIAAFPDVDPRLVEIGMLKTLITHRNSPNARPIRNLPNYCREEIEDMALNGKKLGSGTIDAMLFSTRKKLEPKAASAEV